MKNIDLRIEFTTETQKRFNVEWIAYNDYAEWLEQKLLTIPPVINQVCDHPSNERIKLEGGNEQCGKCWQYIE